MSFFSAIFAPGEKERGEKLDAELAEFNQQRYESGAISQDVFIESELNRLSGVVDVDSEVFGAFVEGGKEGADNIRQTVGNTVNATVGTVGRLIPWQVWVLGAVVALIYAAPLLRALKVEKG